MLKRMLSVSSALCLQNVVDKRPVKSIHAYRCKNQHSTHGRAHDALTCLPTWYMIESILCLAPSTPNRPKLHPHNRRRNFSLHLWSLQPLAHMASREPPAPAPDFARWQTRLRTRCKQ